MAETVHTCTLGNGVKKNIADMRQRGDTQTIVNVICCLIFGLFAFLYLFCFQNDLLAYAQHVLADGTTTYNSLVGAFVITLIMMLLSLFTAKVFARNLSFIPALIHFPSVLLMAAITDVHIAEPGSKDVFGCMWIAAIVLLLVFIAVNAMAKGLSMVMTSGNGSVARDLWVNLFVLFVMLAFAVGCSNTSEDVHIMLRSEQLVNHGRYDDAVEVIESGNVNNSNTTAVKAFALANAGELGDRFFQSHIVKGSSNLLPMHGSHLLMLDRNDIYKALGGIPARGMKAREYLERMYHQGMSTGMGRDYLLTACLMDRDLDAFARYFDEMRDLTKTVPRHFSEALILYTHLKANPVIAYSVPEMEADFDDFQALKSKYPEKTIRENSLRDTYGNTYWFYYFFTDSSAFTQSVSREN